MVNKKAQGAMEFLMTYGWAILIVIVAVAALAYFGILNSGKFLPNSCIIAPGLSCEEFKITSDGVEVFIRNGMGINLRDFKVSIENTICQGESILTLNLADGNTKKFIIPCATGNINSKFKSELTVKYKPQNYVLDHVARGDLTGKVEPGNTSIIGFWAFDEGSGTTTADGSINGYTANLINSPTWTTNGKINNAISFDNVNDHIIINNPGMIKLTDEFTIEVWVNPTSFGSGSSTRDIVFNTALPYDVVLLDFINGNGALRLLLKDTNNLDFWITDDISMGE